jgi:hypothetical protein
MMGAKTMSSLHTWSKGRAAAANIEVKNSLEQIKQEFST